MAFGFPAYHTERIALGTDAGSARLLAKSTLTTLSWTVTENTSDRLVAHVSMNFLSWGEKIELQYSNDGVITVTSKCRMPTQCFDWGKNEQNVMKFLGALQKSASRKS